MQSILRLTYSYNGSLGWLCAIEAFRLVAGAGTGAACEVASRKLNGLTRASVNCFERLYECEAIETYAIETVKCFYIIMCI